MATQAPLRYQRPAGPPAPKQRWAGITQPASGAAATWVGETESAGGAAPNFPAANEPGLTPAERRAAIMAHAPAAERQRYAAIGAQQAPPYAPDVSYGQLLGDAAPFGMPALGEAERGAANFLQGAGRGALAAGAGLLRMGGRVLPGIGLEHGARTLAPWAAPLPGPGEGTGRFVGESVPYVIGGAGAAPLSAAAEEAIPAVADTGLTRFAARALPQVGMQTLIGSAQGMSPLAAGALGLGMEAGGELAERFVPRVAARIGDWANVGNPQGMLDRARSRAEGYFGRILKPQASSAGRVLQADIERGMPDIARSVREAGGRRAVLADVPHHGRVGALADLARDAERRISETEYQPLIAAHGDMPVRTAEAARRVLGTITPDVMRDAETDPVTAKQIRRALQVAASDAQREEPLAEVDRFRQRLNKKVTGPYFQDRPPFAQEWQRARLEGVRSDIENAAGGPTRAINQRAGGAGNLATNLLKKAVPAATEPAPISKAGSAIGMVVGPHGPMGYGRVIPALRALFGADTTNVMAKRAIGQLDLMNTLSDMLERRGSAALDVPLPPAAPEVSPGAPREPLRLAGAHLMGPSDLQGPAGLPRAQDFDIVGGGRTQTRTPYVRPTRALLPEETDIAPRVARPSGAITETPVRFWRAEQPPLEGERVPSEDELRRRLGRGAPGAKGNYGPGAASPGDVGEYTEGDARRDATRMFPESPSSVLGRVQASTAARARGVRPGGLGAAEAPAAREAQSAFLEALRTGQPLPDEGEVESPEETRRRVGAIRTAEPMRPRATAAERAAAAQGARTGGPIGFDPALEAPEHEAVARQAGVEGPIRRQPRVGGKSDMIVFNAPSRFPGDPAAHTTIYVPEEQFTPEGVRRALAESRARFDNAGAARKTPVTPPSPGVGAQPADTGFGTKLR